MDDQADEIITYEEAERRGRYVAAYTWDGKDVRTPVVFLRGPDGELAPAEPISNSEVVTLKGDIRNFRLLAGTEEDFAPLSEGSKP